VHRFKLIDKKEVVENDMTKEAMNLAKQKVISFDLLEDFRH
jgi:hypothetical protein